MEAQLNCEVEYNYIHQCLDSLFCRIKLQRNIRESILDSLVYFFVKFIYIFHYCMLVPGNIRIDMFFMLGDPHSFCTVLSFISYYVHLIMYVCTVSLFFRFSRKV